MANPVLVQLPAGQSVDLFTAVGNLLDAALQGVMLHPGKGGESAAEVHLPDGMDCRRAAERLRRAAATIQGTEYVPEPRDDEELVDPMTVNRMTADEDGGVTVRIGCPMEVAQAAAKNLIAAFLPALDASGAVNYLSFDAVDPETHQRYALIVCRPDGKTPHQLRKEAEAEVERLRALVDELRQEGTGD